MNNTNLIAKLFLEQSNFVLIGLTGRTGSGCTTAATILESENPDFPSPEFVKHQGQQFYNGLDRRRYGILKEYATKNWNKFYSIKVNTAFSFSTITSKSPTSRIVFPSRPV